MVSFQMKRKIFKEKHLIPCLLHKEKSKRFREIFIVSVFLYVFLIIFPVVHWFQETWSKNRSMFFCCWDFRSLVEKLTYICIYVYIFAFHFSFICMILCGVAFLHKVEEFPHRLVLLSAAAQVGYSWYLNHTLHFLSRIA